jgi:predicted phosphodiesterase
MGHGGEGHRADQELVLSALEKDLLARVQGGLPRPDALLVTGDIAFSGAAAQYDEAGRQLLKLARGLGLGAHHIFTVPGNHDVQRAVDQDRNIARMVRALREGAEDLDEVLAHDEDRSLLSKRMAGYLSFATRFAPACLQGSDASSLASWAHRLEARGGLAVRLVGLNTALLAANGEDKGKLRLGKRAIANVLRTPPADNELILVLSHHPLRGGWLQEHDGREADSWLQSRAHIHLFGHVHEPELEASRAGSSRELIRIVAGAVHGERQPAGMPAGHGYSMAALYPRKEGGVLLRVWPSMWSDRNKDFRADVHNLPRDQSWSEHPIASLRLATPA